MYYFGAGQPHQPFVPPYGVVYSGFGFPFVPQQLQYPAYPQLQPYQHYPAYPQYQAYQQYPPYPGDLVQNVPGQQRMFHAPAPQWAPLAPPLPQPSFLNLLPAPPLHGPQLRGNRVIELNPTKTEPASKKSKKRKGGQNNGGSQNKKVKKAQSGPSGPLSATTTSMNNNATGNTKKNTGNAPFSKKKPPVKPPVQGVSSKKKVPRNENKKSQILRTKDGIPITGNENMVPLGAPNRLAGRGTANADLVASTTTVRSSSQVVIKKEVPENDRPWLQALNVPLDNASKVLLGTPSSQQIKREPGGLSQIQTQTGSGTSIKQETEDTNASNMPPKSVITQPPLGSTVSNRPSENKLKKLEKDERERAERRKIANQRKKENKKLRKRKGTDEYQAAVLARLTTFAASIPKVLPPSESAGSRIEETAPHQVRNASTFARQESVDAKKTLNNSASEAQVALIPSSSREKVLKLLADIRLQQADQTNPKSLSKEIQHLKSEDEVDWVQYPKPPDGVELEDGEIYEPPNTIPACEIKDFPAATATSTTVPTSQKPVEPHKASVQLRRPLSDMNRNTTNISQVSQDTVAKSTYEFPISDQVVEILRAINGRHVNPVRTEKAIEGSSSKIELNMAVDLGQTGQRSPPVVVKEEIPIAEPSVNDAQNTELSLPQLGTVNDGSVSLPIDVPSDTIIVELPDHHESSLLEDQERNPTPAHLRRLRATIEDAQWEARAASSYLKPGQASECFAKYGWRPYECFECGEAKPSLDELQRHLLRSHGIVMEEKITAWECFFPSCDQSFCDRQEGLRHAMGHFKNSLSVAVERSTARRQSVRLMVKREEMEEAELEY